MLDTTPLPTYRCGLHLAERNSSALTEQISLTRSCYAAEMRQGWAGIHAVCVLPQALLLLATMMPDDDPVERLKRLGASFQKHSDTPVQFLWPVVAPIRPQEMDIEIAQIHDAPVAWGLCKRPQDWAFSSHMRHKPQYAVA
ncbi:MAG: hypothetical protein AAGI10_02055 [Pseudomonadota bacterium]